MTAPAQTPIAPGLDREEPEFAEEEDIPSDEPSSGSDVAPTGEAPRP